MALFGDWNGWRMSKELDWFLSCCPSHYSKMTSRKFLPSPVPCEMLYLHFICITLASGLYIWNGAWEKDVLTVSRFSSLAFSLSSFLPLTSPHPQGHLCVECPSPCGRFCFAAVGQEKAGDKILEFQQNVSVSRTLGPLKQVHKHLWWIFYLFVIKTKTTEGI